MINSKISVFSSDKNIDKYAYCEALSDEDSEYWEFVFEQLKSDNESNEVRFDALACSTNKTNLNRYGLQSFTISTA